MPELPEVETVRRGLNGSTLHQNIEGGDVLLARTIAHPFSVDAFLAALKGRAIAQWHRRGKYLLAELVEEQGSRGAEGQPHPQPLSMQWTGEVCRGDPPLQTHSGLRTPSGGWLGVHLRMTGQLLWLHRDDPLQKHTRVRLFLGESRELRFVDQRTFGQMWWVPPHEQPETIILGLKNLGPDPFSPLFSVEYLAKQLQSRRRPIKNAILDQEVVAGLGNIYADEALFLSKIPPGMLCTQLSRAQIERLHAAILQVLQAGIAAGGTTFSNFLNVQGVNGNYGGVAWVYRRGGEPCRVCGRAIERIKLAGRSAHFCPQCQRG